MEDRELPLTPLTVCQNPVCALEKRVLEDMVQTKRIECRGSCTMELKHLKEEMAQLKRDMHDLVAKKREKDQLIVISPSYSVRSMNVDKEGAYRTLVDKTRIMEEQLTDIIRSLEETDTPDCNRLAPSEVGKKKQTEEQNQLTECPSSVGKERNVPQMQESEGQLGGREQQRVAETPRAALDEFPVTVMENENIKAGLILEVTGQENQEQLQPSEIQKQKHIEVVFDTVELARFCGTEKEQPLECIELPNSELPLECIELPNSENPPREDLHVEQLESVEIPNSGNSMQRDIQVEQPLGGVELLNSDNSMQHNLEIEQPLDGMELSLEREQPLDGAEFPNSDKSSQQDLQIEQVEFVELPNPEKSRLQDLHMEDIVSNPICVPMNMECSLDFQHLGPYNSELSLDHIESTIEIEMTPTDVPKDSEIGPQEQANQLSGETEAHPYQSGEQQSDDRIQGQLVEGETPRPELPCPGQPEEVRIAKMVEKLVLQQQQLNARSGSELIPFHPTDLTATSQKSSRPQRKRRPPPITYPYTEHRSPKQPRPKKAASIGTPDSDGALDVMPLNVQYYSEEQQQSECRSPRKQSKRKLDYSSTPPKQKGRPRSSSKPKKKQQPKRQKPDSDMDVKTPSDDPQQDEGEASQRSTQDEHQATKTPAQETPETEMPDSEAAVEVLSLSDDQQQQGSKKVARLNASVVKEWLARQGLLDGRKRAGKV